MIRNMGTIDKLLRVLVAMVAVVLIGQHVVTGTVAIILGVVAGIFILTSLVGFCPLYYPFKISTKGKEKSGGCGCCCG